MQVRNMLKKATRVNRRLRKYRADKIQKESSFYTLQEARKFVMQLKFVETTGVTARKTKDVQEYDPEEAFK